ncbi:MAG: 3'-5' exonuclease [Oxalobacter sp.]|nr:MAG: 3'-5' exonuclease [Oxalobacter sp.]
MLNWLRYFFGSGFSLTPEQSSRLAAWHALPKVTLNGKLDATRFVVVDVESSGLNLARDHLIAIGAVAVKDGKIDMADSFEVVLQQAESSSHENILIHGIGGSAQRNGVPPVEALIGFLEYLQKSPLVAFHVTFDQTMIRRAIKQFLGFRLQHDWLDLAYVVPGLFPELSKEYRLLDQWQDHFGIQNFSRHNAVADAISTAQLFMLAARHARKKRIDSFHGLLHVEKAQRWVSWQT